MTKKLKSILAVFTAVAIIFTSYCGILQIFASANNSIILEYTNDFESGMNNLSASSSSSLAKVDIAKEDDVDNKVLSIKTDASASGLYATISLVVPFTLEAGKTYHLSYKYRNVNGRIQLNKGTVLTSAYLDGDNALIQTPKDIGDDANYDNIISYFMKKPGDSVLTSTGSFDWNSLKTPNDNNWREVSFDFTADRDLVNGEYNQLAFKIDLYSVTGAKEIQLDDLSIKYVSGEAEKEIEILSEGFFDFNGDDTIDELGISWSKHSDWGNYLASQIIDIKNNALHIEVNKADNVSKYFKLAFPVRLNENQTYHLSYKYKFESLSENEIGFSSYNPSIWTTGKTFSAPSAVDFIGSSPRPDLSATSRGTADDNFNYSNLIAYFSKNSAFKMPSINYVENCKFSCADNWNTVEFDFSTENLSISSGYDLLSLLVGMQENMSYSLLIDDISIKKVSAPTNPEQPDEPDEPENSNAYKTGFDTGLDNIYIATAEDSGMSITSNKDKSDSSNNVLSINTTNSSSYGVAKIVLPYKLEVGKKYELSYKYKNAAGRQLSFNPMIVLTSGYVDGVSANVLKPSRETSSKDYKNIISYFMKNPGDSIINASGTAIDYNKLKMSNNNQWQNISFEFIASDLYIYDEYELLSFYLQYGGGAGEYYIDDISIKEIANAESDTGSSEKYVVDFNDGLNNITTKIDGDTAAMRNNAVISSVSENGNESNKVLSLKTTSGASGSYPKFQAIFPFELEVGKTYTFSYKYKNVSGSSFQINKGAAWTTGYTNDSAVNIQAFADTVGDKNYDNIIAYFMKNQGDSVVTGTGGINWNSLKTPTNSDWHEVSFTFTADENLVNGLYKQLAFNIQFYNITGEKEIYIDDISIQIMPEKRPVSKENYTTDFNDGLNNITTKIDGDTAAMRNNAVISSVSEKGNETNKVLSLKTTSGASGSYPKFQAIFPFELELGKTYTFSYKYKNVSGTSFNLNKGAAWTTGYTTDSAVNIQAFADTLGDKNYDNIIAYFMKNHGDSVVTGTGGFNWNSLKTPTNSDWHEVSFTFTADEKLVNGLYKQLAFNIQFYGITGEKEIYIDDISIQKRPAALKTICKLEDGSVINNVSVDDVYGESGEKVNLPNTSLFGYEFIGWYTDYISSTENIPYLENVYQMTENDTELIAVYRFSQSDIVTFEDEKDNFDYNYFNDGWNSSNEIPPTIDLVPDMEGKPTKALKVHAYNYQQTNIKLPVFALAGEAYKITFDYRVNSSKLVTLHRNSCLTAVDADSRGRLDNNYVFARLTGGKSITTIENRTSAWQNFESSFIVTEEQVNSQYLYFGLTIAAINTDINDYFIYIDNIKITPLKAITFETDNSEITLEPIFGIEGEKHNLDCLNVPGYQVAGIYTDSGYSIKYELPYFIMGAVEKLYIKYAKSDRYIYSFENTSDVLKMTNKFMTSSDSKVQKEGFKGNHALAVSKNTVSYAVLPFELEKGKEYAVSFNYKSSANAIKVYAGIVGGNVEDSTPISNEIWSEANRFDVIGVPGENVGGHTTLTDFDWEWRRMSFKFTPEYDITEKNKYLTLAVWVHSTSNEEIIEYFYIDDFEIFEYSTAINYSVKYEDMEIDVSPNYALTGDEIILPTKVSNPFVLEGWYEDSGFTKKVSGNTYIAKEKPVTLYGKVSKKDYVKIDFEDSESIAYMTSDWTKVGGKVTVDETEQTNHVLQLYSAKLNYRSARFDYVLLPNRVYEISMRYRSLEKHGGTTAALVVGSIKDTNTGTGYQYATEKSQLGNSIFPMVTKSTTYPEWTKVSTTITTEQPEINSLKKYLGVYLDAYLSVDIDFIIDDIEIRDVGAFDPTAVDIITSDSFPKPIDDTNKWTDWKNWITGEFLFENDNDSMDDSINDTDNEYIDDSDDEAEDDESNTTTKKRRKKKVVVSYITNGLSLVWIIVIVICSVLVVGVSILLFVKYKKRKIK